MTTTKHTTDEATAAGLRLAAEAGDAYERMVNYFIHNVATSGAMKDAGDFMVGVAFEHAEPLWFLAGGEVELHDPPAGANAHVEVVVMDRADKRFIAMLDVTATVRGSRGEIGTWNLPLLWHPTMFHYGRSIRVLGDGSYSVVVSIGAPAVPRHDKANGKRYASPVRVQFDNLKIETGRK
ncbi:MAG TPA: hypothetical protein VJ853_01560 [Thermoanaerobaculia bacterium]|nr:hypothetical protein [Thermoanaerobaculia bacterium]